MNEPECYGTYEQHQCTHGEPCGCNVSCMEKTIEDMVQSLMKMKDMYQERRSDVAEMLEAIIDHKPILGIKPESRYISWEHVGDNFYYDTLTTLVEIQVDDGEWRAIQVEYSDDPVEPEVCPECHGGGYLFVEIDGHTEIQRCDSCNLFESDTSAVAFIKARMEEHESADYDG